MKKFIILTLFVTYSFNVFSQERLNIDYRSFLEKQIEKTYKTKYFYIDDIIDKQINPETVHMLIITNRKEMGYFIDNISDFSNLEKLHLYKVNIKEFGFLNHLERIKIISLAQNRKINFNSLVNNLNKNPNIKHLYITNKRLSKFPNEINKLIYLKSLGINETKIKKIEVNLNLYYLDLSSNKKIDYSSIKVLSSEIINLSNNEIKKFPNVLGKSKVLRALIFSQVSLMELSCTIKGFNKLEILDIFSTNINGIKESCFVNAKKLKIIQQIRQF